MLGTSLTACDHRSVLRIAPALLAVLLALGLASCGGGDGNGPSASGPPADQGAPDGSAGAETTPQIPVSPSEPDSATPDAGSSLALPAGVPTKEARPGAPRADRKVINAWLRALRGGDIERAAALFAQPSKVQNGTPVLTLDSPTERLAFNVSLPCGAKAKHYGTSGAYTIIEFVLTEREGGDCLGAAGNGARGAIRVQDGRIAEWYRLSDDPQAPPSSPPVQPREPRIDPGDVGEV